MRLLRFPVDLNVAEGESVRLALIVHLRQLMQSQQVNLPRDMLVCIHIHGLQKALHVRQLMAGGFVPLELGCPTSTEAAITDGAEDTRRAMVGYLVHCKAYCVAFCDNHPDAVEGCVAVRRRTTKFTCPAASCKYVKERCAHLRMIAARITAGRALDAGTFVLGSKVDDDAILTQMCLPRPARSARTHEQSMQLLESRTKGELPLSLREAKEIGWPFLHAVYHLQGWATQLRPVPPEVCPACTVSLRAPLLNDDAARSTPNVVPADATHPCLPSVICANAGDAASDASERCVICLHDFMCHANTCVSLFPQSSTVVLGL